MANNITNIITIQGVSDERLAEILLVICRDDMDIAQNTIDFNKIIPMPKELDVECGSRSQRALEMYRSFEQEVRVVTMLALSEPNTSGRTHEAAQAILEKYEKLTKDDPGLLKFGEQLNKNLLQYGAPTWYEWRSENWGSKWNSYGYEDASSHTYDNELKFFSAWGAATPVIEQLSRMFPDATFQHQWADEDIGANVGDVTYSDGAYVEWDVPMDFSKEAYEMAAEIMGGNLTECGFIYSESEGNYIYDEDMHEGDEPEGNGGMNLS